MSTIRRAICKGMALTVREMLQHTEDLATMRRGTPGVAHTRARPVRGSTQRLVDAGGVPAEWLQPEKGSPAVTMLYLHGGGWVLGYNFLYRRMLSRLALDFNLRILAVDYRLVPDHPFPAPQEDCLAAYSWLLEQGADPARIIIAGDSAGGHLTLTTLIGARETGLPLPAAGVCLSPATDMTNDGGTAPQTGSQPKVKDALLATRFIEIVRREVLPGQDVCDWRVSPICADLRGLPPLLIQVGDAEVLYPDAARFAAKAKLAGVPVTLDVYPRMWHVHQMFSPFLPEARQAWQAVGAFIQAQTRAALTQPSRTAI